MEQKFTSDLIQKVRTLYRQAQKQVSNNRLGRITEDRMKKRFSYVAKQVEKKERNNDKNNIQELIFYRNKFHSLLVLVGESMRQSYNKMRFQDQVRNILKQDWDSANTKKNNQNLVTEYSQSPLNRQVIAQKNRYKPTVSYIPNEPKQPSNNSTLIKNTKEQIGNRNHQFQQQQDNSSSQQFFESKGNNKNGKKLNFEPVVPRQQIQNNKILADMKKMNKKPVQTSRDESRNNERSDSKTREIKRENEQLVRIVRRRQREGAGTDAKQTAQQLQRQKYSYQKVNNELKQQTGGPPHDYNNESKRSQNIYSKPYRRNDVKQIEYRNLQCDTSKRIVQRKQDFQNISWTPNSLTNSSKVNDGTSTKSNASTKIQRQKQIYINRTPQVLFENQLIKIMIIRYPLRIQQKIFGSNQKLNPQDLAPNEQRIELMVINNAKQIVKAQELFIKVQYVYDDKCHKIQTFKKQNRGYSKKAQMSAQDIVYSDIVKIKLLNAQGYNEQIKALVKAQFLYNSDIKKRQTRMQQKINKIQDKFSIQVKLPVTFIQFSGKPFNGIESNLKMKKLSLIPNPFYDTFQHTYMNTNLPLRKSTHPKGSKDSATIYGRSYIHDIRNNKGIYLQSQINLMWSQKRDIKYIQINTIEQWAYLLSYIFMDVTEEEQEFQRQFRKPSMHVYFNIQDISYA